MLRFNCWVWSRALHTVHIIFSFCKQYHQYCVVMTSQTATNTSLIIYISSLSHQLFLPFIPTLYTYSRKCLQYTKFNYFANLFRDKTWKISVLLYLAHLVCPRMSVCPVHTYRINKQLLIWTMYYEELVFVLNKTHRAGWFSEEIWRKSLAWSHRWWQLLEVRQNYK